MVEPPAKIICGDLRDGSSVYKNSMGYFVMAYDSKKGQEYKKYLKAFTPLPKEKWLYYNQNTRKWQRSKPKPSR